MRKVKIVCHYNGSNPVGEDWKVYNAETGAIMAEVQAFSFGMSIDDLTFIGKIIWLDFEAISGRCLTTKPASEIPEIEEMVEIVSIDMKKT